MDRSAAELVRRIRKGADLTQAELAGRLGTRQSAISAYERGSREPSVAMLARIVRAAGGRLVIETVADEMPSATAESNVMRRLVQARAAVLAAVAAYGGANVRVFGSVARGEAGPGSDLDLLVDLPLRTGIFTLGAIARDVELLVGVDVDVVPASALRPEYRERILAEALPL